MSPQTTFGRPQYGSSTSGLDLRRSRAIPASVVIVLTRLRRSRTRRPFQGIPSARKSSIARPSSAVSAHPDICPFDANEVTGELERLPLRAAEHRPVEHDDDPSADEPPRPRRRGRVPDDRRGGRRHGVVRLTLRERPLGRYPGDPLVAQDRVGAATDASVHSEQRKLGRIAADRSPLPELISWAHRRASKTGVVPERGLGPGRHTRLVLRSSRVGLLDVEPERGSPSEPSANARPSHSWSGWVSGNPGRSSASTPSAAAAIAACTDASSPCRS